MAYSVPQNLGNFAGEHAAAVQVPPGHSVRALVTALGKAKALRRKGKSWVSQVSCNALL